MNIGNSGRGYRGRERELIYGTPPRGVTLLRIAAGAIFYVKNLSLPDRTLDFASADRNPLKPEILLRFFKDALIVAWGAHPNLMSCRELIFIRSPRDLPDHTLTNAVPMIIPELERRLIARNDPMIDVPGPIGVGRACTYPDEIFVATGWGGEDRPCYRGWIVSHDEAARLASTDDTMNIWVVQSRIQGEEDTIGIRVTGFDPFRHPVTYRDPGCTAEIITSIFCIVFDAGSQQITDIFEQGESPDDDRPINDIQIARGSIPEFVRIGDFLPYAYACLAREPEEAQAAEGEDDDDLPICGPKRRAA